MVIAVLAVVVMLLGAFVYGISANPKAAELGRLAFFAGLLAWLLAAGQHVIKVLQ